MKKLVESVGILALMVAFAYLMVGWHAVTKWAGEQVEHLLHRLFS